MLKLGFDGDHKLYYVRLLNVVTCTMWHVACTYIVQHVHSMDNGTTKIGNIQCFYVI